MKALVKARRHVHVRKERLLAAGGVIALLAWRLQRPLHINASGVGLLILTEDPLLSAYLHRAQKL